MKRATPLRPLAAATLALTLLGGASPAPAQVVSVTDGHLETTSPLVAAGTPSRVTAASAGDASDHSFLSGSSGRPARWDPCDPIDYRVNLDEGPRDGLALVLHAVEQVQQATGLVFRYRGTSSFVPTRANTTEDDVDLSIAYVRPTGTDVWGSPAPAGVAGMSWRPGVTADGTAGSRALDGRVVLNASDFAQFDRWIDQGLQPKGVHLMARTVVMHELAHAIGLGHASGDGGQVMAPGAMPDGKVTGWGAGDRAGLRALGAEQGCLRATAADAAAATRPAAEPGPAVPAWQPLVRQALGLQSATTPAPSAAPAPAAKPAATPSAKPTTKPTTAPTAKPTARRTVRPTVRGPRTARRGTTPVLTVTGTPRTPYVLYVRSQGSTRFSAVHQGRLDAAGRGPVALRTSRDVRWYAVVGGTRTGAGLTQLR